MKTKSYKCSKCGQDTTADLGRCHIGPGNVRGDHIYDKWCIQYLAERVRRLEERHKVDPLTT